MWLTDSVAPFVASYSYQVLSLVEIQDACLTQKLQAREPYFLNMSRKNVTGKIADI
jgi:hypothetical protein